MNKNKDKKGEHKIVVEIPVALEKANAVFNMDHMAFAGCLFNESGQPAADFLHVEARGGT